MSLTSDLTGDAATLEPVYSRLFHALLSPETTTSRPRRSASITPPTVIAPKTNESNSIEAAPAAAPPEPGN